MKKFLVSALTATLLTGTASAAFAAANPFEDVPADHWAYDAIAQLAADGVIEGYGDGTYRGDQEITRYEMAQMIARAMAKGGGDKALIDKLAAEFADELNSLGVRVSALEKKVDNVKWRGTLAYVYSTYQKDNDEGHDNEQFVRLRLEPEMTVNKNWTGRARLEYRTSMNTASNAPGNGDDESGFTVDRIWAQGDYKNLQILLGKLPYVTNVDDGMILDDPIAGAQITVGNEIKGTLTVGRANELYERDENNNDVWYTGSYQAVEIYNDRDSKFTWGVGYHHLRNKEYFTDYLAEGDKDLNIWEVGLGSKITDTLKLKGAYAWNPSVDENYADGAGTLNWNTKQAWFVELNYKGADEKDKGSWGAYIAYRKLGNWAVIYPTYDAMLTQQKGWELGLDYVPMKNFMTTFKYFRGKNMAFGGPDDPEDKNAQKFYTELNFYF